LSSESIKDRLDFDVPPHTICKISKNNFAVSLSNQTIQLVSIGDKLITTKQMKLDHKCYGLACKDNILFISDQSNSLYIDYENGIMFRKIKNDKQGDAIFCSNRHISVSSYGKMIYVADFDKGLIVLDLEGNYKTTITDPDFVYIHVCGVCTNKRGNIFVSGLGQSNLVQINEKTGVKLGVLENDVSKSLSSSLV
jgi:outer membrane protein assembly factor BamB